MQARASMMRRRKRNSPMPCTRGPTATKQHSRMLANTDALLESTSKELGNIIQAPFSHALPCLRRASWSNSSRAKGAATTTTTTVVLLLLVRRLVAVAKDVFRVSPRSVCSSCTQQRGYFFAREVTSSYEYRDGPVSSTGVHGRDGLVRQRCNPCSLHKSHG